jgi:DNA-binding response OmpR family regulator
MHVLIADDEAVSRKLLQRYLEKWGHEVMVAEDGQQAWALFQQGDFPIVVTDWMMPKMDGIELIRRIRASDHADYVYTILLTARSQKEDLVEGMEAGADDFIAKPFDRDELRVRLREGERIVSLERDLAERSRALRQDSTANAPADEGRLGPAAVEIVRAIQNPMNELTDYLTALRRELSAVRNALRQYRETRQRLALAQPELHVEAVQIEGQLDEINLDGLCDQTVHILEQVRNMLKNLEEAAEKPGPSGQ